MIQSSTNECFPGYICTYIVFSQLDWECWRMLIAHIKILIVFFRYFFALLTLYICVYNKDMLDIWWFIDIMTQINIKKNYFVINLCHGFRFWLLEVSIKYSLNSLILIIISITFYGVQKQPFYLQYLLQFNNLHKLTSLKWRIIAINIWIMRCHYQ